MTKLNLDNFQLEQGQVRTVTKNGGKTIQSVELLLGSQTKSEMILNEELNVVNLIVRDTDIADIPKLQCSVTKDTLRNFITGLTNLYNTLKDNE